MATVFIILALIGFYLLISSITLRFHLDKTTRWLTVSYSLFAVRLNPADKTGRLYLASIGIKRFSLEGEKEKKPKKKAKEKPDKAKKKKRFKISDFKWKYVKMARWLVAHIKIKELDLHIKGGPGDPFQTGRLYALYWALRGAFPSIMAHIKYSPHFTAATLDYKGKGHIKLKMLYIVWTGLRLLCDRLQYKTKEFLTAPKRGTSYAG